MIAIWARTVPQAREAADRLGLRYDEVLCLGDRSYGTARGRTLDAAIVLPSATNVLIEHEIRPALAWSPDAAWVDLRRWAR